MYLVNIDDLKQYSDGVESLSKNKNKITVRNNNLVV